jgi:hypothetical protein
MIAKQTVYLVLLVFIAASCKNEKPNASQVLCDILPQLVDSLEVKWHPLIPPPPPSFFDGDSTIADPKSTKYELDLATHERFLNRIDSIDSRTIIAITDTCFLIDWDDLKSRPYAEDSLISGLISLHETEVGTPEILNLDQIRIEDGVKLISESEIQAEYSPVWRIRKDYKFAGLLTISKVYFAEDDQTGILQIDYRYEPLDGFSQFILIENKNGKWKLKRMLRNWES